MPDRVRDSERFASALPLSSEEREAIARALTVFPDECLCRGMFFEGLVAIARERWGADVVAELLERAGIGYALKTLGLHPHRDFYKLFYQVSLRAYPELPLPRAMERIAESFYPMMFARSLAGRTMQVLMGRDPATVLARFVDAYTIACPWSDPWSDRRDDGVYVWRARTEPCPYYPHTFQGICRGMVLTVSGFEPVVTVAERSEVEGAAHYLFEIRFERPFVER